LCGGDALSFEVETNEKNGTKLEKWYYFQQVETLKLGWGISVTGLYYVAPK